MDVDVSFITIDPVLPGSRWNAVRNPIVYILQRMDYQFDQIENAGGQNRLRFVGVDLTTEFTAGDLVYFSTDSFNVKGTTTVQTVAFSGGDTLLTLVQVWSAIGTTGFINNLTTRKGYVVDVNVYDGSNNTVTADPFTFSPDSTGQVIIDISKIVESLLSADNDMDFSTMTWSGTPFLNDTNIYYQVHLGYTERWRGSSESETVDTEVVAAVFAGLQIPSAYGGNMLEYVTEYAVSSVGIGSMVVGSTLVVGGLGSASAKKWLTKMDTPVMWRGWPFSMHCIISEALTGLIKFQVTPNGFSTVETTPIAFGSTGKVQQLYLTDVDDTNIDTAKTLSVKAQSLDGTYKDIIQEKTIELRDATCNNILLLGRNSLGGALWWLFDYSQEFEYNYQDGRKAKRMLLTAINLTLNQWEALQDFISLGESYRNVIQQFSSSTIKTSSTIGQQLYVVNQDGSKIGVICIPSKNQSRTRRERHTFEITIEFPEQF